MLDSNIVQAVNAMTNEADDGADAGGTDDGWSTLGLFYYTTKLWSREERLS